MDDAGFYGIAIDGEGALCTPLTSNAGPPAVLRPAAAERGARGSRAACCPTTFDCGWGLRTLAAGASRFNPMSYHNGSVWPHDTAHLRRRHGALRRAQAARRG